MNKFVKGQEISKGYFEVFNFPKKQGKCFPNFCPKHVVKRLLKLLNLAHHVAI